MYVESTIWKRFRSTLQIYLHTTVSDYFRYLVDNIDDFSKLHLGSIRCGITPDIGLYAVIFIG